MTGTTAPELAYPPLFEHERYFMLHRSWGIADAWNLITKDREVGTVNVKDYYERFLKDNDRDFKAELKNGPVSFSIMGMHVDTERAMTDEVNTAIPVLLIEGYTSSTIPPEDEETFVMLIDGNHRMYKAYHLGLESMPAYKLTVEESASIEENPFRAFLVDVVPVAYEGKCPQCGEKIRIKGQPVDYNANCPHCYATVRYRITDPDDLDDEAEDES